MWRNANQDDHLKLPEAADTAELHLRILQEKLSKLHKPASAYLLQSGEHCSCSNLSMHASCRLCIANTMSVVRNVSLAAAVSAYAMLSAVTELPREGVTIFTGCGAGAVLDEVWQRLDLLQGTVVNSFQLCEPLKNSNISKAVQVTILPL